MRRTFPILLLAACFVAAAARLGADEAEPGKTPVELGAVVWLRDFDAAAKRARGEKKPLLVLFQEVPGWSTCQTYGREVLTHPFVVDAAREHFVPACIYNNTKEDAALLKSFKEPSWNNPVVRVMNAERKDLVPRVNNDWTLRGLAGAMVEALKATRRPVPPYLDLLVRERTARKRGVESAAFGMTWFWVGEARLGLLEGVVETRPGWLGGMEVVEVTYDPKTIALKDLLAKAERCACALQVFTRSDAQQKVAKARLGARAVRSDDAIRLDDDKYYTSRTPLANLPMTPLQATLVNERIGAKKDPSDLLSPSQRALWRRLTKEPQPAWPRAIGVPFAKAWEAAQAHGARAPVR